MREALRQPELRSYELACWMTDQGGFSVLESTVYRLLKRHGLTREVQVLGFPAGKEYRVKTTRINEQCNRMRATSSWRVGGGISNERKESVVRPIGEGYLSNGAHDESRLRSGP